MPDIDAITQSEVAAALQAAVPRPTTDELAGLRARLQNTAEAESLIDVAYRILDSPFGPLLVAVTEDGLARVAFEREGHDAVLEELATAISPRILPAPGRTDPVARQLDEYFAGHRHTFDLPVDLRLASGFRRAVLDQLCQVGFGRRVSYADLALAAGNPRAVRAVGSACATNPVPVVVPCHRVVRSDGTIGHYRGGSDMKQALLAMEAAA
jgi:methylated-DNA-[protein]-cysteine S-methyltransferase